MGIFSRSSDDLEPCSTGEIITTQPQVTADEQRQLAAIDNTSTALANAETVEDVKEIRDQAEAIRQYIENAGISFDMQNRAAEIKLRAERKAGQMLSSLELKGGDRRSEESLKRMQLSDLGISKDQSSRWQLLASIEAQAFEEFVASILSEPSELTTASALRFAKAQRASTRANSRSNRNATKPLATAEGGVFHGELQTAIDSGQKYGCLYCMADWPSEESELESFADYLCGLDVGARGEERSHAHLWTPYDRLELAKRVLRAWGYDPEDILIWVNRIRGEGKYWRRAHEFLVLGVRGECKFEAKNFHSWVEARKPRNGSKPVKVRELLEAVSPGPFIQVFEETTARGWSSCHVPS